MHDSRGAEIKVGDRVLIEAKVTELNGGDENFCCCTVEVVLPEQVSQEKVMKHRPTVQSMSTKMLTKIGAALAVIVCLLFIPSLATAQESLLDKLARVEANNAAIAQRIDKFENHVNAMFAVQRAKIESLEAKVDAIGAKLDAMNGTRGVVQTSTDWAGDPVWAATVTAPAASYSRSYGNVQSRPRLMLFPRLRGGSCGAGG